MNIVDGLTHIEIIAACKNVGVDLNCGQCAAIFYTGSGTYEHTCKKKMIGVTTVKLCDGKYEFDLDLDLDLGRMIAARRNGVPWYAGLEWRFSHAIVAMLLRIVELER